MLKSTAHMLANSDTNWMTSDVNHAFASLVSIRQCDSRCRRIGFLVYDFCCVCVCAVGSCWNVACPELDCAEKVSVYGQCCMKCKKGKFLWFSV